jgi:hypothetical protein
LACFDNYIGISRFLGESRSGLYVTALPGVDIRVLDALTTKEQADFKEFWSDIYKRAWDSLLSALSSRMQKQFHVDYKLVSRETSQFQANTNDSWQDSGILIRFDMPKYAVLHVISVGVWAEEPYSSPGLVIEFKDEDQFGELLHQVDAEVTLGRNTINVDRDFETNQLFISYDSLLYGLRKTDNKEYDTGYAYYDKLFCTLSCGWGDGEIRQVNGGGLNVKFNIRCSIEKFLCENINLFKMPLWWQCGLQLIHERRYGNRLNEFTTMSFQDAESMEGKYQFEFDRELDNAIGSQRIYEDPVCFQCNGIVSTKNIIP